MKLSPTCQQKLNELLLDGCTYTRSKRGYHWLWHYASGEAMGNGDGTWTKGWAGSIQFAYSRRFRFVPGSLADQFVGRRP